MSEEADPARRASGTWVFLAIESPVLQGLIEIAIHNDFAVQRDLDLSPDQANRLFVPRPDFSKKTSSGWNQAID